MSAIAPVAASSFAPEERPQQLPATQAKPRRTGRHEPIRSSTPRIAARGAALGLTMAAGVASGANYLEHDPQPVGGRVEVDAEAGAAAAAGFLEANTKSGTSGRRRSWHAVNRSVDRPEPTAEGRPVRERNRHDHRVLQW
jgi:hypothetical protein